MAEDKPVPTPTSKKKTILEMLFGAEESGIVKKGTGEAVKKKKSVLESAQLGQKVDRAGKPINQ